MKAYEYVAEVSSEGHLSVPDDLKEKSNVKRACPQLLYLDVSGGCIKMGVFRVQGKDIHSPQGDDRKNRHGADLKACIHNPDHRGIIEF